MIHLMLLQESSTVLFPFLVASHTLPYRLIFGWPTATTLCHWHHWIIWYLIYWSNASGLQGHRVEPEATVWQYSCGLCNLLGSAARSTPYPWLPLPPSPGIWLSVLPSLASHRCFCRLSLNEVPWGSVPLRRQSFQEWTLIRNDLLMVPWILIFLFVI